MSGHQFRTTPPHPETGIRMTAQYGYHGLEPFQEDVAKYLERPPQELKRVLDESGLALCRCQSCRARGPIHREPSSVPAVAVRGTSRRPPGTARDRGSHTAPS